MILVFLSLLFFALMLGLTGHLEVAILVWATAGFVGILALLNERES